MTKAITENDFEIKQMTNTLCYTWLIRILSIFNIHASDQNVLNLSWYTRPASVIGRKPYKNKLSK